MFSYEGEMPGTEKKLREKSTLIDYTIPKAHPENTYTHMD